MGRKISLLMVLILMGVLSNVSMAQAQESTAFNNSGLPIPRFVTISSDKVFVRTGPAVRYPIKWVFIKDGLPVEIMQEFDTWRKIRDQDGQEGWIHQSLLSGKRNALVIGEENAILTRKPVTDARPVAMLEPKVLVGVKECSGAWCLVATDGYEGWIERKSLWGIYADEELD